MSLAVGLSGWRSKGRNMSSNSGGMAASKGGGAGGAPSPGAGKPSRRRLERTVASKGIDYDSGGSITRRRAHGHEEDDSSDFSNPREEWPVEFSVHGKDDVREMYMMFRFLGLPGPDNLGIDNESYKLVKRTPSGSPINDAFSFRQDFSPGSAQAMSPGNPLGSTSPLHPASQPVDRRHRDVSPQLRPVQTPTDSQANVENRTPPSAPAATPRHGDGRSERAPIGFANVVRQAMEQQTRLDQEAAGVSNFITTHCVEDLPRHGSLPTSLQNPQSSSVGYNNPSRSGSNLSATQQIERSQSDPLSNFVRPSETAVSIREDSPEIDRRSDNELKSGNRAVHNNSADHFSAGLGSVVPEQSRAKLSVPSGSSCVSPSCPQVSRPGASRSFLGKKASTELSGPDGNKSPVMVLKPPPRMSIVKIPQDLISTNEMLGSLAPDAAEIAQHSYFSDDDGNLSDSGDEEETSDVSEAGLAVSGVHPEQPRHAASNGEVVAGISSLVDADEQMEVPGGEQPNDLSNGEVVAGISSSVDANEQREKPGGEPPGGEQPNDLSNGDVNPMDEDAGPGKRLKVDVPQTVVESDVGTAEVMVGPKHPWTKGEQLGAGSFGTVYAALDSDGVFFAVKEVSMVENDSQAQQAIAQLMSEIELLSRFKHDNIVQYLGTEKAHGKLYIFLELVSRGSLAAICRAIKLTHSQICAYTRQILKGLKYLHDRNIVHRDIKCANILVDTKGICKLADFGMAKQLDSLDQMKSCKGSAYWMAPEVIDPKKVSGLPADIWSLGCSILEMATGSPPFGEMEWYRVLWTVGHGTAPPIPETLSETAKDFVKLCLDVNPVKRPTATELLLHPFVRQDGALTPSSHEHEVSFPAGPKTLDTIREEMSAELSSAPR